jgi:hypothetical protein
MMVGNYATGMVDLMFRIEFMAKAVIFFFAEYSSWVDHFK